MANVIDSSAWLEFFSRNPQGDRFAGPIRDVDALIVPTVSIYEVYKRMATVFGAASALSAAGQMRLGHVVDLDDMLAIAAARLSLEFKLAMADSIILATARHFGATLWTQDVDFEGIDGVRYIPRPG